MKRLALLVGINDYPGTDADLKGCLHDVEDWANVLQPAGYAVKTLLNEEATKPSVVAHLKRALSVLEPGDELVFQYSGHGSNVPDTNGDESDGRDECLVLYDFAEGGLLTDDEMYNLLCDREPGSFVLVISDSCHSGTMLRFAPVKQENAPAPDARPRFLDPAKIGVAEQKPGAPVENKSRTVEGVTLISGCADSEFSYDAQFDGRPNGAFTYTALRSRAHKPLPLEVWFNRIRKTLPSAGLPQTPQLTAAPDLTGRRWF